MSAVSKLELLQNPDPSFRTSIKQCFMKSNLETDDGEMIEDKNVQIGGQISVYSSDEGNEQLEVQVGKFQKLFSIWTHLQKIRTKLVILKFSI